MIIKPFNLVHVTVLLLAILMLVVLSIILRKKDQKIKDLVIIGLSIFNILFFVVYKFWLSQDDYDFNIWNELPLHLCNINMFLIPLGILKKNKYLLTFSFYVAPLGAFMALLFPDLSFINNSIFLLRNIGYYGTHIIIFCLGFLLGTLGYVELKLNNIPKLIISAACFSFAAFLINLLLKAVTDVDVNYFYVMNPSGISILELFWSFIPLKYLYLLPAIFILCGYVAILDLINKLIVFLKKKSTRN